MLLFRTLFGVSVIKDMIHMLCFRIVSVRSYFVTQTSVTPHGRATSLFPELFFHFLGPISRKGHDPRSWKIRLGFCIIQRFSKTSYGGSHAEFLIVVAVGCLLIDGGEDWV